MITDVLGFIGSGLATAFGIFLANIMIDRYRDPKLVLDQSHIENEILHIVLVDKEIDEYRFVKKTQFMLHRIKIRNAGRLAAKNCNAVLAFGNKEYKITWKSSEKEDVTINANSYEYIDVCAILMDKRKNVFNWLNEIYIQISEKEKDLFNSKTTYYAKSTFEELKYFEKKIRTEYPYKSSIPDIILPSEKGWGELLKDIRRRYLEGYFHGNSDQKNAKIIISSENTGPISFNIKINPFSNANGSYVAFVD